MKKTNGIVFLFLIAFLFTNTAFSIWISVANNSSHVVTLASDGQPSRNVKGWHGSFDFPLNPRSVNPNVYAFDFLTSSHTFFNLQMTTPYGNSKLSVFGTRCINKTRFCSDVYGRYYITGTARAALIYQNKHLWICIPNQHGRYNVPVCGGKLATELRDTFISSCTCGG